MIEGTEVMVPDGVPGLHTIVGVLPPGLQFPLERAPSLETGNALKAGQQRFWLPMGEPQGQDGTSRSARMFVAFDYFQAMAISLRDGRYFRDRELKDDGYGRIVILNEAAATLLFPGRSAVGGRLNQRSARAAERTLLK